MSTGYLLLDTRNRHAVADGYRHGFYGHRHRPAGTDVVRLVVHTTEAAWDTEGTDGGAERVGNYLAKNVTRPASYHAIVDRDSTVALLPLDAVAFGARGWNSNAVHLAVGGTAAGWDKLPTAHVDAVLERLVAAAAAACTVYGIPPKRLTGARARSTGRLGICGHGDLDPKRRTDPGAGFPWPRFLELLTAALTDRTDTPMARRTRQQIAATVAGWPDDSWQAMYWRRATGLGLVNDQTDPLDPVDKLEAIAFNVRTVDAIARQLAELRARIDATGDGDVDLDAITETVLEELAARIAR